MAQVSEETKSNILSLYSKAVTKGYVPKGLLSRNPEIRKTQKSAIEFVSRKLNLHPSSVRVALDEEISEKPSQNQKKALDPANDSNFHEEIQKILAGQLQPPNHVIKPITQKEISEDILPVFLFSDWHIGETVDPSQVFGFNTFNANEAELRVNELLNKGITLAQKHSKSKKGIVWLGGDFVSGWLHEELIATDYCTPLEAVHWCCNKLYQCLIALADIYGELEVLCSPGNHGRLFKRPSAKISTTTAFDWLIYVQLKQWLEKDQRINFTIPIEGDCWVEILNHRFLFTHGHQLGVNGGDGLIGALGPIIRGAIKTSRSLNSVGRGFTYLVIGHYHQSIWNPGQGVICNGSLIGFNEYAKLMRFRAERPSQLLFFVHKEYGPVIPIDLYL